MFTVHDAHDDDHDLLLPRRPRKIKGWAGAALIPEANATQLVRQQMLMAPLLASALYGPKRTPTNRQSQRSSSRSSDHSNLGKPLDRERVVPADGGFPCGRCLRGDVMRAAVETVGVVWQHQVEIGDVNMRLVPLDRRDPICGLCGCCAGWSRCPAARPASCRWSA